MSGKETLTRANLRTPKAAAVAGIVFSVLLIAIFWLIRLSVPGNPLEPGAWLMTHSDPVALALNLVPFAGISFLWFIGVVRDRLGDLEGRFCSTVFLGSGLLFLAMLFSAAAIIGSTILVAAVDPNSMMDTASFHFARGVAYNIMNVYAIKMAGVFMISTSTVALHTGFAPRWTAVLGIILALIILLGSYYITWSFIVLPVWVFLVSSCILVADLRRPPQTGAGSVN